MLLSLRIMAKVCSLVGNLRSLRENPLMKKDRHPSYQEVLFVDSSNGFRFVCGSTITNTNGETEVFEGKEYPVVRLPITSASHPFFTGSNKFVDTEGRVEKFMNRYEQAKKRTAQLAEQNEAAKAAALKVAPKGAKKSAAKKAKTV